MFGRRTTATATAGIGACALLGAMLLSPGTASGPPDSSGPLRLQPVSAGSLAAFGSCEELRRWYVAATLPEVGPWGLGYPFYGVEDSVRGSLPGVPSSSVHAAQSSPTGTNVQEVGVDETDVAKTDGRIVVNVRGGYLVVTDVTGRTPHELSRLRLPKRLVPPELLLVGHRAIVFGDEQSGYRHGPVPLFTDRMDLPGAPRDAGRTDIVTIDLADPAAPRIESDQRIDGGLLSARQYGDTMRVVTTTGYPPFHFVYPDRHRTRGEARRRNREIVRAATVDDWLPGVSSGAGTARAPLVDCTDVRHPERQSGFGTISVVTFDAASPTDLSATAVTAAGDLVYSSADRLYVATSPGGWWRPMPMAARTGVVRRPTTQVHAFALDGALTRYVASGTVPGAVRDRWSFSEQDGHLRVATALGRDSWNPRENAVVVLDEIGSRLQQVGRVAGIGIHEQIRSVRWLGDLAIVVTFRQTDPLYTLDLSRPRHPRVIGALKIPGYSSYLHPVGDGLLLGIGQDANPQGMNLGAQAATFDLEHLRHPRRVDTVRFHPDTEVTASYEPRAFTYLPGRHVALTAVTNEHTGKTRLVSFKVGEHGSLAKTPRRVLGGWRHGDARTLPLGDSRVAVVSAGVVQIVDLNRPGTS